MKAIPLVFLIILVSCSYLQKEQVDSNAIFLKKEFLSNSRVKRELASVKGILESCSTLIRKMMGDHFVREDFVWSGKKLSDSQINKLVQFTKKAGRKIEKGDGIIVWEPEMMRMGEAVGGRKIEQVVKKNGPFEKELIIDSLIDTNPREVLEIRLHYNDGTIRNLKKIYGDTKSVDFSEAEWDLRVTTRENLGGIKKIEIAHTHPTYALTIVSKDGKRFSRANEISSEDYYMVSEFLSKLPSGKNLTIKAITPNGFYYESNFIAP